MAFSKITETEYELESFLAPYVASGEMPEAVLDQKFLKGDMTKLLGSFTGIPGGSGLAI